MPPSVNDLLDGIHDIRHVCLMPPVPETNPAPSQSTSVKQTTEPRPLMSFVALPTLAFVRALPRLMDLVLAPRVSLKSSRKQVWTKKTITAEKSTQTYPVLLLHGSDASSQTEPHQPSVIDTASDPIILDPPQTDLIPDVPSSTPICTASVSTYPSPASPPKPRGPDIKSYWTGDRPVLASDFTDYSCVHCGVVCGNDRDFRMHLDTPYHQSEVERQKCWFFACVVCDKLCDGIGSYHAHIAGRKHLNREKVFKVGNRDVSALSITYKCNS